MLPNPTHRPTRSSCQTCASCEGEWIWSRQSTSLPPIATLAICPEPRLRHKLKIILEIQAYHYHLGSSSEWVCLHFNRGRERERASQAFPRGEFTLYLHLQKKERVFSGPSSSDRLPCRSVRFEDSERDHGVAIHHRSAFRDVRGRLRRRLQVDNGKTWTTRALLLWKIESKQ